MFSDELRRNAGNPPLNDVLSLQRRVDAADAELGAVEFYARRLGDQLTEREQRLTDMVRNVSISASSEMAVGGSSVAEFEARAGWYFSTDFGVAWSWRIDEVVPYFGINMYFKPVNKRVPLTQKGGVGRRFAMMLGITIESLAETDRREDIIGSKSLIAGAGYRIADAIRLGGGVLIYKEIDPNPLITRATLAVNPYVALSFDWDIRGTFGKLGTAILGQD